MVPDLDLTQQTAAGTAIVVVGYIVVAWINARSKREPSDEKVAKAAETVAQATTTATTDTDIAAPLARVLAAQSERLESLSDEVTHMRGRLAETEAEVEQLQADRDEDRDALRSLIDAWRAHLPEVPLPIRPPQWYVDHPHYPPRGLT